jgi:histidine triad (HIT) family protein
MVFNHFHSVLPLHYIRKSEKLVAFYHPAPSFPVHILLIPTKAIAGIEAINVHDIEWLTDLYLCVQSIVDELNLAEKGYRLVVNGGNYQDIPQLHFHLISEG